MQTTLVIMAAGMWSRYWWLKQIDGFGPNWETILEYSIFDAIRAWFDHVVLVIRESFHQQFKDVLGSRFDNKIKVSYVYQEINPKVAGFESLPERNKPRWTWHAVLSAKELVDWPFCVINADDYYGVDWFKQMFDFLSTRCKENTCSMVWYILQNTLSKNWTVNRGICKVDKEWNLENITERLKVSQSSDTTASKPDGEETSIKSVVSMNFRWFHQSIFDVFETKFREFLKEKWSDEWAEFYITVPPNSFVHSKEKICEVLVSEDKRYGVTYAEDKPVTQEAILDLVDRWLYPSPLRNQ